MLNNQVQGRDWVHPELRELARRGWTIFRNWSLGMIIKMFFQKPAMSADTDSDFSDTEIEKVSSVTKISFGSVPKDIDFDLKIKGTKKVRLQYVLKKDRILPYTAYLQGKNNDMKIERSLYFYIPGFEVQFTKELEVILQGFTGTKEDDGSWMFRMNGKYLLRDFFIKMFLTDVEKILPEIEPSRLTDPRAAKKLPTKLKPVPDKSSCRLLDRSCFSDVEGEEDMLGHRDMSGRLNVSQDTSYSGFHQDSLFNI